MLVVGVGLGLGEVDPLLVLVEPDAGVELDGSGLTDAIGLEPLHFEELDELGATVALPLDPIGLADFDSAVPALPLPP